MDTGDYAGGRHVLSITHTVINDSVYVDNSWKAEWCWKLQGFSKKYLRKDNNGYMVHDYRVFTFE